MLSSLCALDEYLAKDVSVGSSVGLESVKVKITVTHGTLQLLDVNIPTCYYIRDFTGSAKTIITYIHIRYLDVLFNNVRYNSPSDFNGGEVLTVEVTAKNSDKVSGGISAHPTPWLTPLILMIFYE